MSQAETHSNTKPPVETEQDSDRLFDDLSIRLKPAPLAKRSLAFLVDSAIIGAASYVFFVVFFIVVMLLIGGFAFMKSLGGVGEVLGGVLAVVALALMLIGAMAMVHAYFIYFEFKKGQTLGKKILGLRVISLDRNALTLNQAIWREMIRYIDLLLFLPGLISIAMTKKSQRLGDLVANTMVIYSESGERESEFLYLNQDSFFKWESRLPLAPVSENFATNYLTFAFPRFISAKRELTQADVDLTLEKFHGHCPQLRSFVTKENQEELLRFLAEKIRQNLER